MLHSQIQADLTNTNPLSELYCFSEEKSIAEKPEDFNEDNLQLLRAVPTEEKINLFIAACYDCAQFPSECIVVSLIYINRLL